MRLADLVTAVHGAFDVPAAMADVAALCEHDRYQASAGIDAAAAYVAERAADAGLADVEVLRFPADGARRWWTFAGPLAWTPRRAAVRVGGRPVLCYPEQPYALAAYSAPTPPGGLRLPLVHWPGNDRPDPAGALVVLEGTPLPTVLGELAARGAAGVVTDPLAGRPGRWPGQVGRIELPPGCGLFAFSATEAQLDALRRAAVADVEVEVETGAGTLPVVTARLPSSIEDGELLLSAHLCHPMPSANDNASGIAALLGVARAGAVLGTAGMAVRFVWGPEFVGMAAYLHDVVHAGRAARPVAAVNVDMAGEDQRRCGGPLVIERAPDELPSPLSAVAERCAALIPAAARSYSGAVPCDTWAWRATPYVGASDHAMLAGRPTACPAVSLGHWPDAANHTSADTLDLVDPQELRRTATIAGATVAALRVVSHPYRPFGAAKTSIRMRDDEFGADEELAADVADCTVAWAAARVLSALPGAGPPAPPPPPPPPSLVPDGPVLDPWAPEHATRLLDHRGAVALDAVRSLREVAVPAQAADRAEEWIAGLTAHARALVGPRDARAQVGPRHAGAEPGCGPDDAEVLSPTWDGPMNLRHLAECADPDDRGWLAEVTAHDRGGSYARLLAIARGLDGRRDVHAVAWWAALSSELAVPLPMAQRFLRLLRRAGWAAPPTTDAPPTAATPTTDAPTTAAPIGARPTTAAPPTTCSQGRASTPTGGA